MLWEEALFQDPPAKEDCPICYLPMPVRLLLCISLPPATLSSLPINDFVANQYQEAASKAMDVYYPCCGKNICKGCVHSFQMSGNARMCPFCKSDRLKSHQEIVDEIMKRVEANDPGPMLMLAQHYYIGEQGFPQDHTKAMELYTKSADLGCRMAHYDLGNIYHEQGDKKKENFHYEAAAMAGDEEAQFQIGANEFVSDKKDRAVKHWTIAASSGSFRAMHAMLTCYTTGRVSRELMNSTLIAYNKSCMEMRSEARDYFIGTNSEARDAFICTNI